MRTFIKRLRDKDLINRIQNKFFIKIGVFSFSRIEGEGKIRKIGDNYLKKQIDISDEILLKDYAIKHRGQNHYQKNIFPRLEQKNRFKGFIVLDKIKNEIVYLSWIDFKNITIPEIDQNKKLAIKEAYFLDDHCVKHHQRKGLHNAVFNERLLYCKKTGVKKVFVVIYLNNIRALQNVKKYNFKLINTFTFYPLIKKIKSIKF
tara:strand:- start:8007 stop:8615 length:609 start_codon:yes stop_codon:yes gene_type:complete